MSSDPEFYKHCNLEKNDDIEDIYGKADRRVSDDEFVLIKSILVNIDLTNYSHFKKLEKEIRTKIKASKIHSPFSKSKILYVYDVLVASNILEDTPAFRKILIKKASKSPSLTGKQSR